LYDHSTPGKAVDLLGVIYFSIITVTGIGYGDISPVTPLSRILVSIFVTVSWAIIYLLIIPAATEMVLFKISEGFMLSKLGRLLKNHIVICGMGQIGREVLKNLLAEGENPNQLVVVDLMEENVSWAAERRVTAIRGDAENIEILKLINLKGAKRLYLCADKDHTNLMICLASRSLNDSLEIIAISRAEENVKLFEKAGVSRVICLPRLLGKELVKGVTRDLTEKY
jgi:voltage-gated potassium channel